MTAETNARIETVVADLCRMTRSLAGDYQDPFNPQPVREHGVASGRLLEDVLSGRHVVPCLYDLGAFSDPHRFEHYVRRALRARAVGTMDARKRVDAVLRQTLGILNLHAPDIEGPVAVVRHMLIARGIKSAWRDEKSNRPDIHRHFEFGFAIHPNDGYLVKWARGWLGCPGKVKTHPKAFSSDTGDHAGHLIGGQFGAPSGHENLTHQNYLQNQGGGTYYQLESAWKSDLLRGVGIKVLVTARIPLDDYGPAHGNRPSSREVSWEEFHPDGSQSRPHADVYFVNTHTQRSRDRLAPEPKRE